MSKFTSYGPEPQGTGITGKMGMGLLLIIIGAIMLFFMPEQKEIAQGIIGAGLASAVIGGGHKVYKGVNK
jgi:hypothetical protein